MSGMGIEGGMGPAMRGTYANLLGPRGIGAQEPKPQGGEAAPAAGAQKSAFGGALADATLRHELGHLARMRWKGSGDAGHKDADWWAAYDTTPVRCE